MVLTGFIQTKAHSGYLKSLITETVIKKWVYTNKLQILRFTETSTRNWWKQLSLAFILSFFKNYVTSLNERC